jgi:hypothetical protein
MAKYTNTKPEAAARQSRTERRRETAARPQAGAEQRQAHTQALHAQEEQAALAEKLCRAEAARDELKRLLDARRNSGGGRA